MRKAERAVDLEPAQQGKGRDIGDAVRPAEDGVAQDDAIDDQTESQGGHDQVVTLEPDHGQPDHQGNQTGQDQGRQTGGPGSYGQDVTTVEVLPLDQQSGFLQGSYPGALGPVAEIAGGQYGRGVAADGEEAGMAQ